MAYRGRGVKARRRCKSHGFYSLASAYKQAWELGLLLELARSWHSVPPLAGVGLEGRVKGSTGFWAFEIRAMEPAADVVDKRDLKPKPFTLDCNYSNLLSCRFSVETLSGDPTKQYVLVGLGYAMPSNVPDLHSNRSS